MIRRGHNGLPSERTVWDSASWWRGAPSSPSTQGDVEQSDPPANHVNRLAAPLDLELVDILCGVVSEHARCTTCGRPLSRSLLTRVYESIIPERSWIASVSSRCRGLRRHGNTAYVYLTADGLHLEGFAAR